MLRLFALLIGLVIAASPAYADPYGTIVHKDGSMVALYEGRRGVYAAQFNKQGKMKGSCSKHEGELAYQVRKAYMKAKSRWKRGYVPRKFPCKTF